MTLIAVVCALGFLGLVGAVAYAVRTSTYSGPSDDAFRAAKDSEDALSRYLIDAAKPLSRLPVVADEGSTVYQAVQAKLLAAGGAYGAQVEVFLATQGAAALAGLALMLLTVAGVLPALLGTDGLMGVAAGGVVAFAVGILPYARVDRRAKRRSAEIGQGLPEFAELLQMPLTAGLGVMAAIDFTARNTSGPVSDEASNIVLLTKTRAMTDAEAFELAGRRLATPEAKAFFNALRQAHIEGSRVVDVIGRQAETLRSAQFQRQREALKRMPVRLIVVFAIFLLPPVIALVLFNFVSVFGQL